MKRNRLFTFLTAIVLSCLTWAPTVMAAEKIGFVNFREIAMKSDVGKSFFAGLKKEIEKADARTKEKQQDIIRLNEEIKSQGSVTKPEVLREKRASLEKKARDYELMLKDTREDIVKKEQEFLAKIEPHAVKIIRSIGEQEKYTMLLEPSLLMIPYYDSRYDVTERVIAEFNKTYKEK